MSELRVVIFREGDAWLAQGLEHDVGVQAENLRDLIARLQLLLASGLDTPLAELPPALPYFQHLWPHRAGIFQPEAMMAETGVTCVYAMVS